jgi:hypothetical protein
MNPTSFFLSVDMIVCLLIINEYLKIKYPKQHNEFWINIIYNCLYYGSSVQLLFEKNIKPCLSKPYITMFDAEEVFHNIVIIENNGTKYITDTELIPIDQETPTEYKFAIYTQLNDKKIEKKRIYKTLPDSGYDCFETKYKFILVEIGYHDKILKLDLNTEKVTYYVTGNEIDSTVISYLVLEQHQVVLPDDYTITILDHNVNNIKTDNDIVIKFNTDNYEIVKK